MDYNVFKQFEIERFVKKTDYILFPGCGNSCNIFIWYLDDYWIVMCRDMYLDGYHSITAFDYSQPVIDKCKDRDKELQNLKCI